MDENVESGVEIEPEKIGLGFAKVNKQISASDRNCSEKPPKDLQDDLQELHSNCVMSNEGKLKIFRNALYKKKLK